MLQIPLWKRVLILGVCVLGIVFSFPNGFYGKVEKHNDAVTAIEATGTTPELEADAERWPGWAPPGVVNLGLDLRGGVHLLVEVQVQEVVAERLKNLRTQVYNALRQEQIKNRSVLKEGTAEEPGALLLTIEDEAERTRALPLLEALAV